MSARPRMRKFCLLLSYAGKEYFGMQRNPGFKTIEECLLSALKGTGLITEEHFTRPQLVHFQRAARTDKSVSAIKQIVSIKIYDTITQKLDEINNLLPQDIRLMGCRRVINSFDSKNFCDARTYSYLMPTFALCPVTEISEEKYRISKEILDLFNSTLKGYQGTHVFHNFTNGKKFRDDSAVRLIKDIYCSEPFFPCNQQDLEFVVVRIKGQSFMMHQIRKMIGLAIAVVKGFASEEHIKRSMEESYMDIPKAPGLGLLLEEVHFDRYNKKYGGDGQHDPIEWNKEKDAIEAFKDKFIYPVVVETEMKEKSMMNWLNTLNLHSYGEEPVRYPSLKEKTNSGDDQDKLESERKKQKVDTEADLVNNCDQKKDDKAEEPDSSVSKIEVTSTTA